MHNLFRASKQGKRHLQFGVQSIDPEHDICFRGPIGCTKARNWGGSCTVIVNCLQMLGGGECVSCSSPWLDLLPGPSTRYQFLLLLHTVWCLRSAISTLPLYGLERTVASCLHFPILDKMISDHARAFPTSGREHRENSLFLVNMVDVFLYVKIFKLVTEEQTYSLRRWHTRICFGRTSSVPIIREHIALALD
jgi:hypothetical protein